MLLGGWGFVMELTHNDGQRVTIFSLPIPSKSIKLIHITKFDNNTVANFQSLISYEQWDNGIFGNNNVNEIFNHNNYNHLFSIPEIHQRGYRTCQYITTNTVQNESLQYNTYYNNNNSL